MHICYSNSSFGGFYFNNLNIINSYSICLGITITSLKTDIVSENHQLLSMKNIAGVEKKSRS